MLAAGCGASKPASQDSNPTSTDQTGQTNSAAQNQAAPAPAQTPWTGTLKGSDNIVKGNLMLVAPKTTIYIRTARDYSTLVGKKVVVTYKGTAESFVLDNIVAK